MGRRRRRHHSTGFKADATPLDEIARIPFYAEPEQIAGTT